MKDKHKTKEQLLNELAELRQRVAELEAVKAEREVAEEALQESQQLLQSIIDSAPAYIYVKDYTADTDTGHIMLLNRQCRALFGFTSDEVIGSTDYDIFPTETADAFRETDLAVLSAGVPVEWEEVILQDDGPHIYSSSKFPLYDADGAAYAICGISTDITERKQMEEELREYRDHLEKLVEERTVEFVKVNEQLQQEITERKQAEERLAYQAHLLANVNDAILATDDRFVVTAWNQAAEEIHGWKAEEAIGRAVQEVIPSDFTDAQRAEARRALAEEGRYRVEVRVYRKDGQQIYVEGTTVALRGEDGRITGYVSVNRDITERKQMEETLLQSEAKYRTLFTSSLIGQVVVKDFSVLFCNPAESRLFGYEDPGEMIGRPIAEFVHPDDLPRLLEVGKSLVSGEPMQRPVMFRGRHKDGRELIVEALAVLFPLEGGHASLSFHMDVSERYYIEEERKRMEKEKAHSQSLLVALNQAAQAVQRAHTAEEVYQTVGNEVGKLGYCSATLTLTDDREHLVLSHLTMEPDRLRAAEKLGGTSAQDLSFAIVPGGIHDQLINGGQTALFEQVIEPMAESLPWLARPLAKRVAALMGLEQAIFAPLRIGGEVHGLLLVTGAGLAEADVAAVTAFANQTAIALENAQLYQQVQHHASELEQHIAKRTRDLATLYDVTAVTSKSLELQVALERSLERVLEALQCDVGAIQLRDETGERFRLAVQRGMPSDLKAQLDTLLVESGLTSWLLEYDEPLVIPNITVHPNIPQAIVANGFRAYLGAPMRAAGQVRGVLSVFCEGRRQHGVEDVALLASVADHMGVAVENARLRQRAEQAAVLEERERLARELHDAITQSLYSLPLFAEAAQERAESGEWDQVNQYLGEISETCNQVLKEARLMLYELHPPVLEQEGLVGALRRRLNAVEGRGGVEARVVTEELAKLPTQVEEELYRIAQEALNNALKHAAATSVTVHVCTEGEHVILEVLDDGRGFDPDVASSQGGMGLMSMRERAEKLGGTLTIFSKPGRGTRVQARVSMKPKNHATSAVQFLA